MSNITLAKNPAINFFYISPHHIVSSVYLTVHMESDVGQQLPAQERLPSKGKLQYLGLG
jgi:hypothetical protein